MLIVVYGRKICRLWHVNPNVTVGASGGALRLILFKVEVVFFLFT